MTNFGTISLLIDFYEHPHSENVQENVNITHEFLIMFKVLGIIEVGQPIEK